MSRKRGETRRTARRLLGRWDDPEEQELKYLILGMLCVFLLSMTHDEIVQEMIDGGMMPGRWTGLAEVAIGLVLFLIWGFLAVRMAALIQRARQEGKDAT